MGNMIGLVLLFILLLDIIITIKDKITKNYEDHVEIKRIVPINGDDTFYISVFINNGKTFYQFMVENEDKSYWIESVNALNCKLHYDNDSRIEYHQEFRICAGLMDYGKHWVELYIPELSLIKFE